MNYDVLHNFISPVTGRVLCKEDYILVGNRDNIADPSPALIDTKLDLIKLRHDVNELLNATFILEEANFKLPKAQALNILDNGFMYNTGGIISTTNDVPLPSLEYKHLWIGDSNNKSQAVTTIDIDNLPSLGTTDVPTPTGGFVGKVWEGTSSGRPEESSIVGEMFADIGILNAKFLAGHFVMNSGLTASFPKAQFLNALTAGGLVKTSSAGDGKLEAVTLNQDQILMGGANNVPESRARIGIENLPLLADKKLWSGNADSIPQSITTIDISNLPNLANNNLWMGGEDNRPIAKVSIDITNLPNLEQNKLWLGDAGNRPVAQSTLNVDNLPNLTNNMVWQGNAQGRPTEVELNFAPVDATYILKTPKIGLNNAQVLSELVGGILKSAPLTGTLSNAISGVDYAAEASVVAAQATADGAAAEATAAATAAAAAPAAGAALAAVYFNEQMLPYSLVPLVPAGASISAAIGIAAAAAASAASDASSAQTTANTAITRIDNLNVALQGDIIGSGNLKNPVITTFKSNPVFTGTGSMTIPVGTTAERPSNPTTGMVRLNTEL
jgi:hypothetical protein